MFEDLGPRTRVAERFRIDALARRRPLGSVYHASREDGGRFIAWHFQGAEPVTRAWPEAFLHAAEGLKGLTHPSIPNIVGASAGPEGPVLVTVAPPGQPLRERLLRAHRLPRQELQRVLRTVAEVLDELHAGTPPRTHAALCPEDILLREDLRSAGASVWVEGSGFVHCLAEAGLWPPEAPTVELAYQAPRAILTAGGLRADLFSLASIAFEALTGVAAFPQGPNGGAFPSVVSVREDLSPELDTILLRAWSPDPSVAYTTGYAFARDLGTALQSFASTSSLARVSPRLGGKSLFGDDLSPPPSVPPAPSAPPGSLPSMSEPSVMGPNPALMAPLLARSLPTDAELEQVFDAVLDGPSPGASGTFPAHRESDPPRSSVPPAPAPTPTASPPGGNRLPSNRAPTSASHGHRSGAPHEAMLEDDGEEGRPTQIFSQRLVPVNAGGGRSPQEDSPPPVGVPGPPDARPGKGTLTGLAGPPLGMSPHRAPSNPSLRAPAGPSGALPPGANPLRAPTPTALYDREQGLQGPMRPATLAPQPSPLMSPPQPPQMAPMVVVAPILLPQGHYPHMAPPGGSALVPANGVSERERPPPVGVLPSGLMASVLRQPTLPSARPAMLAGGNTPARGLQRVPPRTPVVVTPPSPLPAPAPVSASSALAPAGPTGMAVARRGAAGGREEVLSAHFPGNDQPPVKILTPKPPPVVTPPPVAPPRNVWIVAAAIILAALILTVGQFLLAR
ncbi:MAG: hypothetical protein HY909_26875 [Deltaproteobacteria bacterium]|nr:hypothetical protein [Deltaproteobacteria bacterium]